MNSEDKVKIALIEDDSTIVEMYLFKFELEKDFEVRVANDGAHGLELIASFKPDIILLDMMMPKMSGLETLTRLRSMPNGDNYKVIALTNMKDDDTVAKIRSLHVDDYLIKAETSPRSIVERIRGILNK